MESQMIQKMFGGETFSSVFEVGCSEGRFLKRVNAKIYGGIDTSKSMIAEAQKLIPTGTFAVWDAQVKKWPVADKQYDIAFTNGTLMYMYNPVSVINEMMRISRRVIIAEPNSFIDGELGRFVGADDYGTRTSRNYVNLLSCLGVKDLWFVHLYDKLIIKFNSL